MNIGDRRGTYVFLCNKEETMVLNTSTSMLDKIAWLNQQEVIRIFIRCLLKYNWEVHKNLKAKLLKRKNREIRYIKESYENACEEYKKIIKNMK